MITPQNGIFAQGTHSHYFLELDIRPGISAPEALLSLRRLRAPDVSAGGVNFVIAFGADLWRALAPGQSPADLKPFAEIHGADGHSAPAQQHAVWLWFNGSTPDVVFEHARRAWLAVEDIATLATEQPCFVYRDSRDLTGFLDGTANPEPLDAPNVALIPTGAPGAGGSHVLVMRWVHDLTAFHAMSQEEQEATVGRSKDHSQRIGVEQMPRQRARQEDPGGMRTARKWRSIGAACPTERSRSTACTSWPSVRIRLATTACWHRCSERPGMESATT